jgi:fumarylacetoacetase
MSWVEVPEGSDFPIENLPFGVARIGGATPTVVTRLGDQVLDLAAAGIAPELTARPTINELMASGRGREIRERAAALLDGDERADGLHPVAGVEMMLPVAVADYVDFYSSIHHATNLGKLFRPDADPLLANWRRIPVGYHGRAGSVVVSGTPVRRPCGITPEPAADGEPRYAPSRALDIELEVGFVIGRPGTTIRPDDADRHVFGAVLLNDWSARDIQAYEYQPLGPHLGKSFATTISAWVVTLDALAPFLTAAPPQDPLPDPYLRAERPWALDAQLAVDLNGEQIAATGFASMYWTFAQQLAHMTANGAVARTGDLIGSGTVSGPGPGERGSLIELSWRGAEPITLGDGTTRSFLADGDIVTLRGGCGGTGGTPRVGFGECTGRIEPAREGNG